MTRTILHATAWARKSAAAMNANLRRGEKFLVHSTGERTTVLVVEDEALIRMLAVEIVENLGFAAIEATSADEAIGILEVRSNIRIVFTDINMGGSMDGLQLVECAHRRWPPIRFIVVSGDRRPATAQMPPHSHFFAKPYDAGALETALRELAA